VRYQLNKNSRVSQHNSTKSSFFAMAATPEQFNIWRQEANDERVVQTDVLDKIRLQGTWSSGSNISPKAYFFLRCHRVKPLRSQDLPVHLVKLGLVGQSNLDKLISDFGLSAFVSTDEEEGSDKDEERPVTPPSALLPKAADMGPPGAPTKMPGRPEAKLYGPALDLDTKRPSHLRDLLAFCDVLGDSTRRSIVLAAQAGEMSDFLKSFNLVWDNFLELNKQAWRQQVGDRGDAAPGLIEDDEDWAADDASDLVLQDPTALSQSPTFKKVGLGNKRQRVVGPVFGESPPPVDDEFALRNTTESQAASFLANLVQATGDRVLPKWVRNTAGNLTRHTRHSGLLSNVDQVGFIFGPVKDKKPTWGYKACVDGYAWFPASGGGYNTVQIYEIKADKRRIWARGPPDQVRRQETAELAAWASSLHRQKKLLPEASDTRPFFLVSGTPVQLFISIALIPEKWFKYISKPKSQVLDADESSLTIIQEFGPFNLDNPAHMKWFLLAETLILGRK
jgi:hypothetical protein